MKINKEYAILLSIIAVLCLYLVFNKINRTNYELPQLDKIDKNAITRIEIRKDSKTVVLQKDGDKWNVGKEKYKADRSQALNLAGVISDLSLTTLISTEGDYERYDLDKKKRIEVVAYQDDKIVRSFTVGKTASSYSHTFVMIEGNKNIYHARGNIRYDMDKKADDFRDKLVLKVDEKGVNKIALTSLNRKKTIIKNVEKKGEKTMVSWKDEKGKAVKKESLEGLFTELRNLKCSEYIHEPKENFRKPDYSIFMFGTSLSSVNIYKKGDDYILTSSQNPYPFKINNWTKDQIIKHVKALSK